MWSESVAARGHGSVLRRHAFELRSEKTSELPNAVAVEIDPREGVVENVELGPLEGVSCELRDLEMEARTGAGAPGAKDQDRFADSLSRLGQRITDLSVVLVACVRRPLWRQTEARQFSVGELPEHLACPTE